MYKILITFLLVLSSSLGFSGEFTREEISLMASRHIVKNGAEAHLTNKGLYFVSQNLDKVLEQLDKSIDFTGVESFQYDTETFDLMKMIAEKPEAKFINDILIEMSTYLIGFELPNTRFSIIGNKPIDNLAISNFKIVARPGSSGDLINMALIASISAENVADNALILEGDSLVIKDVISGGIHNDKNLY